MDLHYYNPKKQPNLLARKRDMTARKILTETIRYPSLSFRMLRKLECAAMRKLDEDGLEIESFCALAATVCKLIDCHRIVCGIPGPGVRKNGTDRQLIQIPAAGLVDVEIADSVQDPPSGQDSEPG